MINKSKILWKKVTIVIVFLLSYVIDANSAQTVTDNPFDFLKRGMLAYKNGQINQTLSAFQCAANMGNIGANWKLGHIYANGDGGPEDDYKAYHFFAYIVEKGVSLD